MTTTIDCLQSKVLSEARDTHFGQLGVVQKVRPVTVNESAKCQAIPPAKKDKKKENEKSC